MRRGLRANMRKLYYANYVDKIEILDDSGNPIGWETIYSPPVRRDLNISAGRGEASAEVFGLELEHDRVIGPDTKNTPIDIYSVLWLESEPKYVDGKHLVPHDHVPVRIADSKNVVMIAAKRVDVGV